MLVLLTCQSFSITMESQSNNKFQSVDSSLAGLADVPKLFNKVQDMETQMTQLFDAQKSSQTSLDSITSTPPSAQLLAAVDDITASVTLSRKRRKRDISMLMFITYQNLLQVMLKLGRTKTLHNVLPCLRSI